LRRSTAPGPISIGYTLVPVRTEREITSLSASGMLG
jgi:hypothetical protein